MTYAELTAMSKTQLDSVFTQGATPRITELAGWEWRGWNEPFFTKLLGIKKFIKGFFESGEGVEGYNIPVRQGGFAEPWTKKGKPFGFYRVSPEGSSLLLDYGASPRNPFWRPERLIRDYLVQPDPANGDILLGRAYLQLCGPRVFSNYFILERLARTEWKP